MKSAKLKLQAIQWLRYLTRQTVGKHMRRHKGRSIEPTKNSFKINEVSSKFLYSELFKAQGAGYQTRINTVLRAFRDASI